jgi:hypothetical protein
MQFWTNPIIEGRAGAWYPPVTCLDVAGFARIQPSLSEFLRIQLRDKGLRIHHIDATAATLGTAGFVDQVAHLARIFDSSHGQDG